MPYGILAPDNMQVNIISVANTTPITYEEININDLIEALKIIVEHIVAQRKRNRVSLIEREIN